LFFVGEDALQRNHDFIGSMRFPGMSSWKIDRINAKDHQYIQRAYESQPNTSLFWDILIGHSDYNMLYIYSNMIVKEAGNCYQSY